MKLVQKLLDVIFSLIYKKELENFNTALDRIDRQMTELEKSLNRLEKEFRSKLN